MYCVRYGSVFKTQINSAETNDEIVNYENEIHDVTSTVLSNNKEKNSSYRSMS